MPALSFTLLLSIISVAVHSLFIGRAILRPHREPAARIAWVLVILSVPFIGMLAYILLGETNIGRARRRAEQEALARLPSLAECPGFGTDAIAEPDSASFFRVGQSVDGFGPVDGNQVELTEDSNAAVNAMVRDIDAAADHVHIAFYIWLADNNGLKVLQAVIRAAGRGVTCRVMADSLGSRLLIESEHWRSLAAHGVKTAVALRIGNPLLRIFRGRIDLRNHRKIVVIDNLITYVGSQNCADPEFRIKAKFAPWVDIMLRIEGPLARQNQRLFANQWMAVQQHEDLGPYLLAPLPLTVPGGVKAQVTGTGPTTRNSAMPEIFASVIASARRELVISTPYFVPDEFLFTALCTAARSGVRVTLIVPARNDSWVVAAASRSYYLSLLVAGVKLHEYRGGLLHAKTMTADGQLALVGSANFDRRSFDLNYENNALFADTDVTAAVRQRQQDYLSASSVVSLAEVSGWSMSHRFFNNAIAMFGPLL